MITLPLITLPLGKVIVAILLPGGIALAIAAVSMANDDDERLGLRAGMAIVVMFLVPAVLVGITYLAGILEVVI